MWHNSIAFSFLSVVRRPCDFADLCLSSYMQMKKLMQRFANALKQYVLGRQRRIHRIALASQISHTFRRLECRRVLSVTAAFDNTAGIGKLTVDITNDGGNTAAALLVDQTDPANPFFYADTNNDQSSAGELAFGVLSSLKQIQVNGAAGVGSFAWRGDFTASNSLQSLLVQNVNSTTIESTATLLNDATVSSQSSINFGGDFTVNGNLTAQVAGNNGQITDSANGSLNVLGNANLNATDITLGAAAGDNIRFGSLTVTSTGTVQIIEDSSMQFSGTNTAGSIDVTSSDSIRFNSMPAAASSQTRQS